jgi:hypothetical protein
MSFGPNNSINKLIESKDKDPFRIEEHFFGSVLFHRKSYDVYFKDPSMKISSTSYNHRVSTKIFEHNKVYPNNIYTKNVYTQIYIK